MSSTGNEEATSSTGFKAPDDMESEKTTLRKRNDYDYDKMLEDFHLRDSIVKERKKRLKKGLPVNIKRNRDIFNYFPLKTTIFFRRYPVFLPIEGLQTTGFADLVRKRWEEAGDFERIWEWRQITFNAPFREQLEQRGLSVCKPRCLCASHNKK